MRSPKVGSDLDKYSTKKAETQGCLTDLYNLHERNRNKHQSLMNEANSKLIAAQAQSLAHRNDVLAHKTEVQKEYDEVVSNSRVELDNGKKKLAEIEVRHEKAFARFTDCLAHQKEMREARNGEL